jgi:aminoglycoside 3-N-acetyltransferase
MAGNAPYDAANRARVTRDEVAAGLRAAGLRAGDLVQVHSSLSALGYVEGGADAVVEALLEVLGPEGTLMVPTFNHGSAEVFDVRETPSTNGAITEAVRRRPEAFRSVHPTHPYAAIGPLADLLTNEHLHLPTFDLRSPLGKLAAMGGSILLLGVGMNRNTMAHVGETLVNVPCIGQDQWPAQVMDGEGHVRRAWGMLWREGPCLLEWDPLEQFLRDRGQIRDGHVGEADVQLMLGAHVLGAAARLALQLCPQCRTRPARLP